MNLGKVFIILIDILSYIKIGSKITLLINLWINSLAVSIELFSGQYKNVLIVQVVEINDLLNFEYIAYMIKYDSTHCLYSKTEKVRSNHVTVNSHRIYFLAEKDVV